MPHFLKDQAANSARRLRQASKTHEHTVGGDAALMFPAGVKLFWPSIIQLFHRSQRQSLKGLFRETSRGWRTLVKTTCDYSDVGVCLAYCSLHRVDKMSLEGIPNKETFLSQKTAGSWLPYFLYPQLHSSFVHPSLLNVSARITFSRLHVEGNFFSVSRAKTLKKRVCDLPYPFSVKRYRTFLK